MLMSLRTFFIVAVVAALAAVAQPEAGVRQSAATADSAVAQDLDAFIESVMAANLTPGLAVAVVRGADVLYAKGFGYADRERKLRVNADTLFYIASTTKSFTALAAALLASRGARCAATICNPRATGGRSC